MEVWHVEEMMFFSAEVPPADRWFANAMTGAANSVPFDDPKAGSDVL